MPERSAYNLIVNFVHKGFTQGAQRASASLKGLIKNIRLTRRELERVQRVQAAGFRYEVLPGGRRAFRDPRTGRFVSRAYVEQTTRLRALNQALLPLNRRLRRINTQQRDLNRTMGEGAGAAGRLTFRMMFYGFILTALGTKLLITGRMMKALTQAASDFESQLYKVAALERSR